MTDDEAREPTNDDLPLTDPEELAAALPDPASCVVLLDFDGTLSHLRDDPDAAEAVEGVDAAVHRLAATTRIVFVSGRAIDNLRPRLPTDIDAEWAGGHGAEYAARGDEVEPLVDDVDRVVGRRDAAIEEVAAIIDVDAGWVIERKPTGMAVHWRMVDDPSAHHQRVVDVLHRHAVDGMQVAHGHDVVELRPAGLDKGTAAARLLDGDDRTPIAIGDDVTDEDMFAEVVARAGVAVLVAAEPRSTLARWRVAGPEQVVTLLMAWADAGD
jgi:trehalose-phosphatase